jgi:hypothetical protein
LMPLQTVAQVDVKVQETDEQARAAFVRGIAGLITARRDEQKRLAREIEDEESRTGYRVIDGVRYRRIENGCIDVTPQTVESAVDKPESPQVETPNAEPAAPPRRSSPPPRSSPRLVQSSIPGLNAGAAIDGADEGKNATDLFYERGGYGNGRPP